MICTHSPDTSLVIVNLPDPPELAAHLTTEQQSAPLGSRSAPHECARPPLPLSELLSPTPLVLTRVRVPVRDVQWMSCLTT